MKYFFVILLIQFSYASCLKKRAALDIGSGTTKLKIGTVDYCKNKVVSIDKTLNIPVGYKKDLKENKLNNEFSQKIMDEGIRAFIRVKNLLNRYEISDIRTAATSAFRTAKNAKKFIHNIYVKTGIVVEVITQRQEALLGYKAASSLAKKKNYLVWDIGGGSMQMTYKDSKKTYIYEGKMAAVPFKRVIIDNIQGKKDVSSPNPFTQKDVVLSKKYAYEFALKDVDKEIQDIVKLKDIDIIGIGGVHSGAILGNMGKADYYTYKDLNDMLEKRYHLADKQIGGKYAATSTSNMALVLGFMMALNINKVITGKINLADGLLLD
ncbi:MAG: hypothetical protein N4A33_10030 [Bacteriovoracaceae bacterium]|jgi:exopolyphosphatase/guanosine-5'-triphosphate,3'-diphosphate pyrophosphatase|nr:hypothetical protein [Bacteriovoracaceae bacterium]